MTPIRFRPLLKRIRWGGRRLGDVLRKNIGPESDYAESWELCDHGADQSVVDGGPFDGLTLQQLMAAHATDICGVERPLRQFPLLIKFLDATDRLSVQVHPDDIQARFFDPRENGKTEAWLILDAAPGSRIFAGLKPGIDQLRLQQHLNAGTVEHCLHAYPVQAGDCVMIPAGTVHAIGEGILLAEVQQSSDLTFRLHDWGRLDANGQPRELHLDESLVCIDFDRGPVNPVVPRVCHRPQTLRGFSLADRSWPTSAESTASGAICSACITEELVTCEYFTLDRHVVYEPVEFFGGDSFHALLILDGTGTLQFEGGHMNVQRGETILLPAALSAATLTPHGHLTLLDAYLPIPAPLAGVREFARTLARHDSVGS